MLDTGVSAELEAPPPADQKASTTVAQSRAELMTSQLITLRACQVAVLQVDNVDAIHKMRVTTRRLQASLDLLQTGSLASEMRRIKKRLRRWRRLLSQVRNYDVFLIMVHKQGFSPRTGRPREQFEHLHAILHKRRARRMASIRRRLERIDIEAIASRLGIALLPLPKDDQTSVEEIGSYATDIPPPEGSEYAPDPPVQLEEQTQDASGTLAIDEGAVAANTANRLEQRLAEFQLLVTQSHPTNDPQELHQLRIAAKRLRYLIEITTELGYGTATATLAYLRSLQDKIGDWHDLQALEEEIVGIVTQQNFVSEHLAESSAMLAAAAQIQKRKETLVSRLFPVRVPRTVAVASERLVRSLRRSSSIAGGRSRDFHRLVAVDATHSATTAK